MMMGIHGAVPSLNGQEHEGWGLQTRAARGGGIGGGTSAAEASCGSLHVSARSWVQILGRAFPVRVEFLPSTAHQGRPSSEVDKPSEGDVRRRRGRQKTEDRRQKTEDRRQKTEGG